MKSSSSPLCWTPSSSAFAYPKLRSITVNKGLILLSLSLSITYHTSRIFEMTLSFQKILFLGMSYSHSLRVSEKQICTGLSFSLLWSVPFRQQEYKNTASSSLNCIFFLFVFNYMVIQYSILSYIHFEAHRYFCCLKSAESGWFKVSPGKTGYVAGRRRPQGKTSVADIMGEKMGKENTDFQP